MKLENLISKICETLRCSRDEFDHGLDRDNCGSWDSLAHIEIIFAVEEFNGEALDPDVIANLNSTNSIIDFFTAKSNG